MNIKRFSKKESLAFLNAFQAKIIEFANNEGIILSQHFDSVDAFKQFVIALAMKMLTDMGIETRVAYDLVMGDGSYDELAARIWEDCQE